MINGNGMLIEFNCCNSSGDNVGCSVLVILVVVRLCDDILFMFFKIWCMLEIGIWLVSRCCRIDVSVCSGISLGMMDVISVGVICDRVFNKV